MTLSTGISTTSMFLTPQAVDDFASITEGSGFVFTFDVMSNDLGGNAKTLYAITTGPESDLSLLEIADLQTKDIAGVYEATEKGAQAAIVNGKIVYNTTIQGIVVDAAQVAVTFTRFARGLIPRTNSMLDAWYKDLSYWLKLAQFFSDSNYWPTNDKACFRCAFRPICSKAPEVQEQWLKASFPTSAWDPLIIRGDI